MPSCQFAHFSSISLNGISFFLRLLLNAYSLILAKSYHKITAMVSCGTALLWNTRMNQINAGVSDFYFYCTIVVEKSDPAKTGSVRM